MGLYEEHKLGETPVRHCPSRERCPLGNLCATEIGDTIPLFPQVVQVKPGDIVWTDLKFGQQSMVIRSGAFACMYAGLSHGDSALWLFGLGDSVGFTDQWIPFNMKNVCHIHALTEGEVCSFSGRPLKRLVDSLPPKEREQLLTRMLVAPTSDAFMQVLLLSKQSVYERLIYLFIRLVQLIMREGRHLRDMGLTHETIAKLVGSDRVSVTRALHKLEKEGLVELGYRSIRLTDTFFETHPAAPPDAHDLLFTP